MTKSPGNLRRVETVTPKELADAIGLSYGTILARLHLYEREPKNPHAIPFLKAIGRPYKIPRSVADDLLTLERCA
jgi:hypothetical protein